MIQVEGKKPGEDGAVGENGGGGETGSVFNRLLAKLKDHMSVEKHIDGSPNLLPKKV